MFEIPYQSDSLADALARAFELTDRKRDEFMTPEHLLWAISQQRQFFRATGSDTLMYTLSEYIEQVACRVPDGAEYDGAEPSVKLQEVIGMAYQFKVSSGAEHIDVPHVLQAIFHLDDTYAKQALLEEAHGDRGSFMSRIIEQYDNTLDPDLSEYGGFDPDAELQGPADAEWRQYVVCLNDHLDDHNPLIGREHELQRTLQILCRKDKNNPLHVGEPGVGKTAIAYGLAAMIERGDVPERLRGCRVYQLDGASLIAGTQYRGEYEKRLKGILQGLEQEVPCILYIDEIHTIIGAGRVDGSTMDASNLLKPYLESGTIRFMGATTFDEYKRTFDSSRAFARRFEKVDIPEPTVEECKEILRGLKEKYERYHGVVFTDDAIDFAAEASAKYITGRFLPDKAIDLIDEAGAWRELHPSEESEDSEDSEHSENTGWKPVLHGQTVDRELIADVLAKVCKVTSLADKADDKARLEHLEERLKAMVYGQDHAIMQVTEAVMMGSAGLIDDNKPLASLLFVGPTGVGKTEVARVLADTLGLPLVRFDMSEYAEKHTVAKLIGAPAGYVGYDDGGLLTDAIRRTPHCVLLFDEIEKAHSDIYNILLQVMDYASLTDSKGQKADFRHVIFIMTTNAGAQRARQGAMGYVKGGSAGQAMIKAVKQTFKPEFINRLTDITIFNDMDRTMASLILDKKLRALRERLCAKDVTLHLTDEAHEWLLDHGFSVEYGGREIERVVNSSLKPLLMREILFGSLRSGGDVTVGIVDDTPAIVK